MSDISTNISFPVSDEEAKLIEAYYGLSASPTHSDYIRFEAKISNCKITLYKKKDENGCCKALFQGPGAVGEASIFHDVSSTQKPLPKVKVTLSPKKPYPFRDQIGSDEVGTGSFFGCRMRGLRRPRWLCRSPRIGRNRLQKNEGRIYLVYWPNSRSAIRLFFACAAE